MRLPTSRRQQTASIATSALGASSLLSVATPRQVRHGRTMAVSGFGRAAGFPGGAPVNAKAKCPQQRRRVTNPLHVLARCPPKKHRQCGLTASLFSILLPRMNPFKSGRCPKRSQSRPRYARLCLKGCDTVHGRPYRQRSDPGGEKSAVSEKPVVRLEPRTFLQASARRQFVQWIYEESANLLTVRIVCCRCVGNDRAQADKGVHFATVQETHVCPQNLEHRQQRRSSTRQSRGRCLLVPFLPVSHLIIDILVFVRQGIRRRVSLALFRVH
eukprot:scaffold7075_cov274-Pinguiococcus_pyrenoidosus.AAC.1